MSDKKKDMNELADMDDFNERYNHYLQAGEEGETEEKYTGFEQADSASEYEDISSYSDEAEKTEDDIFRADVEEDEDETPKKSKSDRGGNFFSRNHYRNTKIIALSLVIVMLLGAGGFLIWFYGLGNQMKTGDDGLAYVDPSAIAEQQIYDDDSYTAMGDVPDSASLNQWLKNWALNGGEKMSSKNVINVLLCGIDGRTGDATDGRSDSMIIISVNKKAKTISMVSLLRDSWTYMSLPREDGTHYDYYYKLNGSYSYGGPTTLMETIENDFKIEIDQYIAVDFTSFKKLIDALGGVTVEVTQKESDFIRRTSSHKNFPVGKAKLNGTQALIYSRIRHLDDDVMRTGRQRKVIKALIESAKTATNGQIVNAFKQVAGYMRTGYTQSEVMSLIAQAVTYNWMDYDMENREIMLPDKDYDNRISTYIGKEWTWVVDYVLCAQTVQKLFYGETNIVLKPDRTSALDFVTGKKKNSSSSSDNSSYSYSTTTKRYYDDDDDYERTTKKRHYYDEDDSDEDITDIFTEPENTTEAKHDEPKTEAQGGSEDTPPEEENNNEE